MAKFKIEWIKIGKTSTGKDKADTTVTDEQGNSSDLTIWGDFPNFANLVPGMEIEGEVSLPSNPNYKPSLNAPRTPQKASGRAFGGAMAEKLMEKKETSINKFADRKEDSIAKMSAERDAVLIVTTFYKEKWGNDSVLESELDSLIKKKVTEYRDWFLGHEFGETLPF